MSNQMNVSFLHSLVDKVIRINKGGPESKVGRLLAVSGDYVAIHTEENDVLFYNTEHIKSVSEDSKEKYKFNYSSKLSKNTAKEPREYNPKLFVPVGENKVRLIDRSTLGELLSEMKDLRVQINQGGPESRKGTLLGIYTDYLVLNTVEEGVLYYNIHHIKSVNAVPTNDSTNEENTDQDNETSDNDYTEEGSAETVEETRPSFIEVNDLNELYHKLKKRWVRINRGGPDWVEGILVDAFEDQLVLVNEQELFYIPTFHIKSINSITLEAQQANNSNSNGNTNGNTNGNANGSSIGNEIKKSEYKSSQKNGNGSRKSSKGNSSRKRNSSGRWKLAKSKSTKKKSRSAKR